MPGGLRVGVGVGGGRRGGEKRRRRGCERRESSRPCVSHTRNANTKLLCSPFWPCDILSGGMVAPVPCVDGTHWHMHTCTWACSIDQHRPNNTFPWATNKLTRLIFRLLFAVAIAGPAALSSPLPGSGREIEGVIKSELRDLHPLTCGSVLSRLLLLPPHFLDISDHNVTTFSPCVAVLFVWTEPWPVVQFVGHLKIPNQC